MRNESKPKPPVQSLRLPQQYLARITLEAPYLISLVPPKFRDITLRLSLGLARVITKGLALTETLDDHYQADPALSLWRSSHTRKIATFQIL